MKITKGLDDRKIQKNIEDKAIEDFTKDQLNRFKQISENLQQYSKELEKLNNQFTSMSSDDPQYEAVWEQLKRNKNIVSGLKEQKNDLITSLEKLGQEEAIKAQEILEANSSIQQRVDDAFAGVIDTRAQIAKLESKQIKSSADFERLNELYEQLEEDEAELKSAEKAHKAAPILKKRQDVKENIEAISNIENMPTWMKSAIGTATKPSKTASLMEDTKLEKLIGSAGPMGKLVNIAGKILDVTTAVRKSINSWVDEAAGVLANNVGRINAALEGTGQTYQNVTEDMVESLGLNRFVKQTDYISQIANLTSRGITYNVEQRALLETIKDKTVAAFESMDSSLLRLIRLRQQDLTATQFGLEAALRNTLNKVFKDSTYLRDLFSGIQSAVADAVVISGSRDVTEYSSVVQTWMGAMYESGVDSGMVTKLANAINALGSGNVSALASDSDIQRLILLSMDTVGMDYADILQQGLSSSDINDLLTAIVKYLTEIESNTKNNNVLTSSYTQLFGMSMADLQAFKNLSKNMGSLTYVDQGSALSMTKNEIQALQSTQRTLVNEQIDNAFANAKFTFGSSIAKDASSYMTWKVSNLMLDVVEQVVNSPIGKAPIIGTIAKGTGLVAEMAIFGNELKGILSIAKALPSLFSGENTGLQTLINGAPTYGGDSTSISASMISQGSTFKTVNTMETIKANAAYQTEFQSHKDEDWEKEEDKDPILSKLEELDKIKVKNEAGNEAFAVFLTGMTNETLMSFASIFAPSEMENTFTGQNNILNDNWFKYGESADDTTSNSTKKNNTSS